MTAPVEGLAGKTAIVTGGYGVLGASMASGLAEAGVRVAILGRRRDAAEAQAERIRAEGGEATVLAERTVGVYEVVMLSRENGTWKVGSILEVAAGPKPGR